MTRADETGAQIADIRKQLQAAAKQCEMDMKSPDLDLIRSKVELFRAVDEAPPPFEIASNDTFPTPGDRRVIAEWASIRDECLRRRNAISYIPASATPLQATVLQQLHAFSDEAAGRVSELIIDLYQAKLTYGEFAQKRYEIAKAQATAERQFRESALVADQQRQVEAQQLAQQQFQNNLVALNAYMQSVSARQPQTVYLQGNVNIKANCTSQKLGSFVNTSCQ